MKKLLAILCFIAAAQMTQAQSYGHSYKTALGVKFYPGGITLKHFTRSNTALEGIGYFWERGARITGLYEIHGNIAGAPGLKWYIGPGAHINFYNTKHNEGGIGAGIDGVLGLDYKFKSAPISLSVDWQPSFEFGEGTYRGLYAGWGGLAVRYTF